MNFWTGRASKGAIEAEHGWPTYAADHLALLGHLGIERCHFLGNCNGSSFCLKLLETSPERISTLVLQKPIGAHPEFPTYFQDGFTTWADDLYNERSELDREAVQSFRDNLWNHNFVYSVDWDFVRNIDLPALVLPGNDTPHPAIIGIEVADILPGAERLIDWKRPDYSEPQRNKVVEFLARSVCENPVQKLQANQT